MQAPRRTDVTVALMACGRSTIPRPISPRTLDFGRRLVRFGLCSLLGFPYVRVRANIGLVLAKCRGSFGTQEGICGI